LRVRAERLGAEVAGVGPARARRALAASRGRVRLAIVVARRNLPAAAAARALRAADGSLRAVLEERFSR
jgi:N-acetylmuramic acid 6-phosphate (MurNAc-6-P) etherase